MFSCPDDLLNALVSCSNGSIVCSGDCSLAEIRLAQKEGRWFVNNDNFGFILRPPRGLEYEAKIIHAEEEIHHGR